MEEKKQREKRKITTIKLEQETKARLDRLKEHEKESYDTTIKKLLNLLNVFRKNPEQGKKILKHIDTTLKRKQVYFSIPEEKITLRRADLEQIRRK